MEFHVGRDEGGGEFCICSGSCTTATDVVRNVMDLWDRDEGAGRLRVHPRMRHTFSQFLSATMGPSVARVSAPRIMPSLNKHPTIVVPVLVALGRGMPRSVKKLFLNALKLVHILKYIAMALA